MAPASSSQTVWPPGARAECRPAGQMEPVSCAPPALPVPTSHRMGRGAAKARGPRPGADRTGSF